MTSRRNRSSSEAFSLTELLVGVVIGGLLVGLATPAVQGALDKSKQSKDLSNLRQIGQGITLFSGENDGRLPPSSCKAETQEELELSWIFSLRDYLGQNYDELRISPSDPHRETRRRFQNTSYLINQEVDEDGSLSRFQKIDRPSLRILLFLASDAKNPRGQEDHIHTAYMGNWARLLGEIKPDAYRGRRTDRTVGSSPYLFADGHAEMIPAARIKQLVDSGKNIAKDSL